MSETKETQPAPKITRRQFLAGAGAVGATAFVKKELEAGEEGVKTPSGRFKFLYEDHRVGINPKDIPLNSDIFFREFATTFLFDRTTEELIKSLALEAEAYSFGQAIIIPFPGKILQKLSKIQSEIMFGDVDSPLSFDISSIGSFFAEFILGLTLFKSILEKKQPSTNQQSGFSRREFLKKSGKTALGIWSASRLTRYTSYLAGMTQNQTSLKRIFARIEGLQEHFHPEDLSCFARDLVMADKLLLAADDFKKNHGRPPLITVQTESGHSGIEDLLRLGPDFCRAVIKTMPKPLLEVFIRHNGGIENFLTVRFIRFGREITAQDLTNPEGLLRLPIEDRRLTDEILMGMLQDIKKEE